MRRVHAEGQRLRRTERNTDPCPDEPAKLRVTRPHPSQDRLVGEVWGHGPVEELEAKAERKRAEYGDEYEFTVVAK